MINLLFIRKLYKRTSEPLSVESELPVSHATRQRAHAFKKIYKRMNEQEQNTCFGIAKPRLEHSGNVSLRSERIS